MTMFLLYQKEESPYRPDCIPLYQWNQQRYRITQPVEFFQLHKVSDVEKAYIVVAKKLPPMRAELGTSCVLD